MFKKRDVPGDRTPKAKTQDNQPKTTPADNKNTATPSNEAPPKVLKQPPASSSSEDS